jgi:hypothetical protein
MNKPLSIDDMRTVYRILRAGGLYRKVKLDYSSIYQDRHYFFDYIIKIGNTWSNICLMNKSNSSRYKVLLLVNEHIKSSRCYKPTTIKIVKDGDNEWFVESIEEFPTLCKRRQKPEFGYNSDKLVTSPYNFLCEKKKKKFLKSIETINKDIQSVILPVELAREHCYFFTDIGYAHNRYSLVNNNKICNGDVMLSYCDIFSNFHLNRVKECDDKFIFTGIQSCAPYAIEKVKDILYEKFINE